MPSVSTVFVAGLLLGAGASLGGGALLAPMGVPGVELAEPSALPVAGTADTTQAACETLAGMGALPSRGRVPPDLGDLAAIVCRSSRSVDASSVDWQDRWIESFEVAEDAAPTARPPIFDRLLARGGDQEDAATRAQREAALWYALATVHALTGDAGATMSALEKAAGLNPYAEQIVYSLGQLEPDELAPAIARLVERAPGLLLRVRPLVEALLVADPPKTSEAFALGEKALDRPREEADDRLGAAWLLLDVDAPRTDAILVPRAGTFTRSELAAIATRFLDGGSRPIAATWWKRVCEKAPAADEGALDLRRLRREFDPTSEVDELREKLRDAPDDGNLWSKLASLLAAAGDKRGAFEATREALRVDPQNASLLAALVELDAAAALPFLEQHARGPKNVKLLRVLGFGFAKNGLLEKAEDAFFQAEERTPGEYELLKLLVALDPTRALVRLSDMASRPTWETDDEVLGARANALLATGDAGAAFQAYVKALEHDPGDGDWLFGLAQADPVRALPLLEARRVKAPKDADAWGALAEAYAATGRVAEAATLFEAAIAKGGSGGRWPAQYAKVAPERALALAQEQADLNPGAADNWVTLGDVYRQLGDVPEARAAYERAQARERRGAEIAVRLAQLK